MKRLMTALLGLTMAGLALAPNAAAYTGIDDVAGDCGSAKYDPQSRLGECAWELQRIGVDEPDNLRDNVGELLDHVFRRLP